MKALSLIIKLLILVAIVGLGVIIYTTCSGAPLVQRIDKTKPDTTNLHEIATQTHIYYAKFASENGDGTVDMSNWYEQAGNKWVFHENKITLIEELNPRIIR